MDSDTLNEYSREFAKFLFTNKPEWEQFARLDEHPKVSPGSLLVEIKPPNPSVEYCLEISTDDNEITVALGRFHTHFDSYENEKDGFNDALQFIEGIISEHIKVVWWMNSGKWIGSSFIEGDEKPDASFLQERPDEFVQRSWSGKYDIVEKYKAQDIGHGTGGTCLII